MTDGTLTMMCAHCGRWTEVAEPATLVKLTRDGVTTYHYTCPDCDRIAMTMLRYTTMGRDTFTAGEGE